MPHESQLSTVCALVFAVYLPTWSDGTGGLIMVPSYEPETPQ